MGGPVGTAVSLGGKAAQGAGGKGHGGGSSGGLSPQQAALAEYTMGQNILKNESVHASSGTGLSTMKTVGNIGAQVGGAMQAAGMADTNAQNTQAVDTAQQNLNDQSLSNIAQQAGFNSGSNQGGSFSNQNTPTPTG